MSGKSQSLPSERNKAASQVREPEVSLSNREERGLWADRERCQLWVSTAATPLDELSEFSWVEKIQETFRQQAG